MAEENKDTANTTGSGTGNAGTVGAKPPAATTTPTAGANTPTTTNKPSVGADTSATTNKATTAKTDAKDDAKATKATKDTQEEIANPEAIVDRVAEFPTSEVADGDDKSFAADKAFQKEVDEAVRKKEIDREVERRLAQTGLAEGAIDTRNPQGLKPGEKPMYIVGGQKVDADGRPWKAAA